LKIAMVSMNAGPLAHLGDVESGGQSVVVDCLSRALSLAGHAVTISTLRDDPSLPGCLFTASGVHVDHVDAAAPRSTTLPMLVDAIESFGVRLAREWAMDRPDVIHAHSWMSGKAAVGAARGLGIPVVQTFHGLARAKRGRAVTSALELLRLSEESVLVRSAARIVATSSAEVFALLGMGTSPGAIKLIPCGVDLEQFRPAVRPRKGSREALRVATLSRLVPDAGVADVIEALPHVAGVQLIIGGGQGDALADTDARVLETLARTCGVADRVQFRGRIKRDDVASFLREADVVVCAPWHDSIGTVALEAMACGVPVIASAVGGHVDAVADGITGMHVPPRAPRQIAYALAALAVDAVQRERFSRLGIERASARYGWPRVAAETVEVYRAVAAPAAQMSQSRA
jgi:glycosyltransferase involved in cell wall biosynthesis